MPCAWNVCFGPRIGRRCVAGCFHSNTDYCHQNRRPRHTSDEARLLTTFFILQPTHDMTCQPGTAPLLPQFPYKWSRHPSPQSDAPSLISSPREGGGSNGSARTCEPCAAHRGVIPVFSLRPSPRRYRPTRKCDPTAWTGFKRIGTISLPASGHLPSVSVTGSRAGSAISTVPETCSGGPSSDLG